MDFKEDGTVTIDKVKKKKIKCYRFHYKPLNRYLMLHIDLENNDCTSLSDFSTGYRLFKLQTKADRLILDDVKEKLEKYVNHFTIEGIQEEINRLQSQELELVNRKKQ